MSATSRFSSPSGDEDGPQAAAGMGPQDAEPLTVRGRSADRVGRVTGVFPRGAGGASQGLINLPSQRRVVCPGNAAERGRWLFIGERGQALEDRAPGRDGGQAPGGVAVALDVPRDESIHRHAVIGVKGAVDDEVVGQRAPLSWVHD